jgi:glycosyltransferase involved in cell wall biosynthesis
MRLMLLTADYHPDPWSGIAQAVERQASGLSKIGAEVHVLYPARKGSEVHSVGACGPHLHNLDQPSFPVNLRGFDYIHLHSLALAELALEIRRRTGIPLIYTAHSLLACEIAGQKGAEPLIGAQTELMRVCDKVVFLSRSEHETGLRLLPELSSRSAVVGNAVKNAPPPSASRGDGPVVFAGRFARTKGIATLCGLLRELHVRWPGSFVLAGGHGDAESFRQLQLLASELGSSCSFPGWLNPAGLERLLASASLVVVPSEYEPFGMVALEAMRLGAPVLAAEVGGLAEVAGPGSGAILVDSHDAQQWVGPALAVLNNRRRSNELRLRGPRWTTLHFGESEIAQKLMRFVYAN